MNERDFFYWLQGFFELSGAEKLDANQVQMIKEHMDLVATKVTPTSREPDVGVPIDPWSESPLDCETVENENLENDVADRLRRFLEESPESRRRQRQLEDFRRFPWDHRTICSNGRGTRYC